MKIALLLAPGYGLLAYASLREALFILTRDNPGLGIKWCCVATGMEPIPSLSGQFIAPEASISDGTRYDVVIVISAYSNRPNAAIASWLRVQARHGAVLGAVTSGLWLLADAGLIGDRKCTLHWADFEAFRESYPDVNVSADLYVIDRGLITCSGGVAAADMLLDFLSQHVGRDRILVVQETLVMLESRSPGGRQKHSTTLRFSTDNKIVIAAVELVESQITRRNIVSFTSRKLGVSTRWLQQLFREHVGHSIKEHQAICRTERAKEFLSATDLSVFDIAIMVGYSDGAHMAKSFSHLVGLSPTKYRMTYRGASPRPTHQLA